MNLAEKAFRELFPEKRINREFSVKYSRAFKPYNANVRYDSGRMAFSLSHKWKDVSQEIKTGLLQSLMLRVFKARKRTLNIDLYDTFMKKIGDYSEVSDTDPVLEKSFLRVNQRYFSGFLDQPNLKWSGYNFSKLGTYDYGSNTVSISRVLSDDQELLDYIMYHELLHKKHKFRTRADGISVHHTAEFRKKEKEFENPEIEKKLGRFLRKKRLAKSFSPRRRKKNKFLWFS